MDTYSDIPKQSDDTIATISTCMGYLINHPTFWDVCFDLDIHGALGSGLDEKNNFPPNQRFYAIRSILSGRSPVFRAMFRSGLRESNIENKLIPIHIPDVTPKAFLIILEYIYTNKFKLCMETSFQVLYAAKKYCLQSVIDECITFIKSNINYDNALNMLTVAYKIHEQQLIDFAEAYVQQCSNIINCKSFFALPEYILKTILERSMIYSNEINILFAVIRWAEYQLDGIDGIEEIK